MLWKEAISKLGLMTYTCNSCTWEAEARGLRLTWVLHWVTDQYSVGYIMRCCLNNNKQHKKLSYQMAGSKETSDSNLYSALLLCSMASHCLTTQALSTQLIAVSYSSCFCTKYGNISFFIFLGKWWSLWILTLTWSRKAWYWNGTITGKGWIEVVTGGRWLNRL